MVLSLLFYRYSMRLFNAHFGQVFSPRNIQLRLTLTEHDGVKSCPKCAGRDFHLSNRDSAMYWMACACGFVLRDMAGEQVRADIKWPGIRMHRAAATGVLDLWQKAKREPTRKAKQ